MNTALRWISELLSRLSFTGWIFIAALVWICVDSYQGQSDQLEKLTQFFSDISDRADHSTLFGGVALLFAFVSFKYNRILLDKAIKNGELLQEKALVELQRMIKERMNRPALMTEHSIRSLVMGIEKRFRCPVITDKLVTEAIRGAALDLELELKGPALVSALEILETLRVRFDESGPPLLSLALVDRLAAYKYSQPIAVGALVVILFLLIILDLYLNVPWLIGALMVLTLGALFCLVAANLRANSYWQPGIVNEATTSSPLMQQLLHPHQPHAILDLFLTASMSHSRTADTFWHILWGPVWESGLTLNRQFVRMHDFRFFAAEDAKCDLKAAERRLAQAHRQGQNVDPYFNELSQIHSRLWRISGDAFYKTQALRMLRATSPERKLIADEIQQEVESQGPAISVLKKQLRTMQKEFYRSRLGQSVSPLQVQQLLQEIIDTATRLWRHTDDVRYRQIAEETAVTLQNYRIYGNFFASEPNKGRE